MTDKAIWKEIEKLGWTKDHDYTRIGIELLRSGHKREIEQFVREKASALYCVLDNVFTSGGDDAFEDLRFHIVGSGKAVYDAVLADPAKCNKIKYRESFIYCFHLREEDLKPSLYLSRLVDFLTNHADVTDAEYRNRFLNVVRIAQQVCDSPDADNIEALREVKQEARELVDHPANRSSWLLPNVVHDLLKYAPHFPK